MADLKLPDLNRVILAGRLTRDPELRYISADLPVCKLGLAVSRFYKGRDGERKEDTLFINVTCWRKTAEWVGEAFKKGRPVIVEGSLKSDEWEDKNTGQKRTSIEVVAQRIQALDWEDRGDGGGRGGGGSYSSERSDRPSPRRIEEPVPEDDIPF